MAWALAVAAATVVWSGEGQAAVVNGASMALRSSGVASGTDWTLTQDGYVGTYITLASPGAVELAVSASGVADGGVFPNLQLAIDDTVKNFPVASGANGYSTTVNLPAGTHFVRVAYSNDDGSATRALTVRNLNVTGASISNSSSNTNALNAAQTYADNYRKGTASVSIQGAPAGATVEFKLRRNAFNLSTSVTGTSLFDSQSYILQNPTTGSTAQKYQERLLQNFNTIVPSNGGKWSSNQPTQNNVQMGYVDGLLNFASAKDLAVRQHTLIWDNQQPSWVNTLLTNAQSTDAAVAATAKAQLSTAIANRIAYYIGSSAARGAKYIELDGLNEALRTGTYWKIFGAAGIADIYNKAAVAAAAAGNPNLRLYTNEWNVLQFSTSPTTGASDPYANWYRQNVDDIRDAIAGPSVSGIGIQYYADSNAANHSASRILSVLQNLAIEQIPISLTEFNIKAGGTEAGAVQILTETMKLMYGSPDVTTFGIWEFWAGTSWAEYSAASLYDLNWNLTAVGAAYQNLLAGWTTDITTTLGASGLTSFTGTYGDYDVIINGASYSLTHVKGDGTYTLVIPEPATIPLAGMTAPLLLRRRR